MSQMCYLMALEKILNKKKQHYYSIVHTAKEFDFVNRGEKDEDVK